jgi:Flp pilus assembly protein TadD
MATISEALAIAAQHHQAGRLQAAEQIYRQILAVEPDHAQARHRLGLIAFQVGRHEVALEQIGRAIALNGSEPAFHSDLGGVYRALGRIPEAIHCLGRALELKPDDAGMHYNLGLAWKELGKLDEATASLRRALELKPDFAEAHNNLGNALKELGRLDEAVACYGRALELKPHYVLARNNLGLALKDQGKLDEAVACCRQTMELKPDFADAHNNLGIALKRLGRLDEAAACFHRALELKPDFADAHGNQALLSLLTGDFPRGWSEYLWRRKTKESDCQDYPQPLWDGQPLEGRTILLHPEQGLGDVIQFVRYAELVKQRGAAVIVQCPSQLVALLASCAGIDRLVGRGEPLPAFDLQAPLLSLPGIFHTSLADIPAAIPYLSADPGLVEHWRRELDGTGGFKVGIAWQGSPTNQYDRDRSIPLRFFEPLARCCGVRLLSLQKHWGVEQLQEVASRFPVIDLGSRLDEASGPFMDTAAVMKNLDLVVTSDTAIAHLAGALGVRVWVALAFIPDWRWLLDRGDSPWYPTMRLFRQRRRGDWQGVFNEVQRDLCELSSS